MSSLMKCACAMALGMMLAAGLAAQEKADDKAPKGSVTGHVVYADTKAPARLAQVLLLKLVPAGQKAKSADDVARGSVKALLGGCGLSCYGAAGLDGRFEMTDVPAGRYLVLASQLGALNPLARLDMGVLNAAGTTEVNEDQVKDVMADLTVVTVAAGKTADVTVSLGHGDSISGVVLFDDGSPAVGVRIHLLKKTKAGVYEEPNQMSLGAASANLTLLGISTDDQGRYRIAGLTPGSYALRVEVPLSALKNLTKNLKGVLAMEMNASGIKNPSSAFGSMMSDGLSVYSGNVLAKKDLTPVELTENEQKSSVDMTIPLGAMHSVTARVVDAATGHALDVARVLLLDAEGKETLRSGFVDDDGNCTFDYVPEGMYTLRAADAMDLSKVGKMLDENYDPKKAVRYGSAETKVQVSGDVSDVLLQVSRAEEKKK